MSERASLFAYLAEWWLYWLLFGLFLSLFVVAMVFNV